ncbi:MAG: hypothetical protein HQ541_18365 [Mariniphaga sp.]|nr:hypothetical protein [Mariniphaga sp.]
MAGYLFNLDNENSLINYIQNGIYSTKLSAPNGIWKTHHEATFADYVTMKSGDNVYFFIKRKIYGIGELVKIKIDCKYCNYPNSSEPINYDYNDIKLDLLWDEGNYSANQRWICLFKPSPFFFKTGIDMDNVLASNPNAFKMLRAFWKVSFIKFDDLENQAFKDVILKFNKKSLNDLNSDSTFHASNFKYKHREILNKKNLNDYSLDIKPILRACADGSFIRHEMAIEAGILSQLTTKDETTIQVFGDWDYLSHQVIASPFKPIDYIDKMDVFGYSYITGYSPTRSRYLVIEIKKDKANAQDIEQLMKYVGWVKDEYCYGDYSMIESYLVAYEFEKNILDYRDKVALRKYTLGRRPAISGEWKNLKIIKYFFDNQHERLQFDIVKK